VARARRTGPASSTARRLRGGLWLVLVLAGCSGQGDTDAPNDGPANVTDAGQQGPPPDAPPPDAPPPDAPPPDAPPPEPRPASVTGCVQFERRSLGKEGLSPLFAEPAAGLRVTIVDGAQTMASVVTDQQGCFDAPLAAALGPMAAVELSTIADFPGEARPLLAVVHNDDPDMATRHSSAYWTWSSQGDAACGLPASSLSAPVEGQHTMQPLSIPERCGSGAIAAFQAVRRAMLRLDPSLSLAAANGQPPASLAVFWSPDVKSGCGACFLGSAMGGATVAGEGAEPDRFDTFIQLSGRDDYPTHWSASAMSHEAGHWVMDTYSRSENAMGKHFFTTPSPPGLAYKEGWATAFAQRCLSSTPDDGAPVLYDPVYLDVQHGETFWVDLSSITSSLGKIDLPSPEAGVDQPINEFVVAAALWRLWLPGAEPDGQPPGLLDAGVLDVLGSPRLLGGADRGHTGLDLLDFLDASVCTGRASADGVAAAMAPLHFPWDSSPLCP
jgi:hypothetical protein